MILTSFVRSYRSPDSECNTFSHFPEQSIQQREFEFEKWRAQFKARHGRPFGYRTVPHQEGQNVHRKRMHRLRGKIGVHITRGTHFTVVLRTCCPRGLLLRIHPRIRVTVLSDVQRATWFGQQPWRKCARYWCVLKVSLSVRT